MLIHDDNKLRVFDRHPGILTEPEVTGVLQNSAATGTILSDTSLESRQILSRILMSEKKTDLVNEDIRQPSLFSVLRDTVPDVIKHDQHTHRAKLLRHAPDVIAGDGREMQ